MTDKSRYKYRPIKESDGIRLLELKPNPDLEAMVEYSLIHTTLHKCDEDIINHYTALSYVWGKASITKPILVEGSEFHVTLNLDSALRYMRDSTRKCLIWADALCINQLDDIEKGFQVMQMGNVYRNATHTIIFLGKSTDNTDLDLHKCRDGEQSTSDSAQNNLPWEEIIGRPWFQRVWVYQELVFSLDPWIQCGKTRVRWAVLCDGGRALPPADQNLSLWKDILLMDEGWKTFAKHRAAIPKTTSIDDLLSLMEARRGLGVFDPRDMFFAHQSMLDNSFDTEETRLLLSVNYRNSCSEVYEDLTKYMAQKSEDLRFLSLVEVDSSLDNENRDVIQLPSWVPDWRRKTSSDHRRLRVLPVIARLADQRKSRYRTNTSAKPYFPLDERHLMVISGTHLGIICLLSEQITPKDAYLKLRHGYETMDKGEAQKAIVSENFNHWKEVMSFAKVFRNFPKSVSVKLGNFRATLENHILEYSWMHLRDLDDLKRQFSLPDYDSLI